MEQNKVDVPNALDTNLNVDMGKQIVEISQRSDRFALHPQKVTIPFQAVVILAAQILLAMNGVAPQGIGQQPQDVNEGQGRAANESRHVQ